MSRRRVSMRRPPWAMERLEYAGILIARAILWVLGRRAGVALTGFVVGRLVGRLPFVMKRARANLALVRPELNGAGSGRMLRDMMANFGRTLVEYVWLRELVADAPTYEVEGLEHLIAARDAAGGKMVVAGAHYGNWEAVRAVAALHEAPLAIIYRAFNNKLFDDYAFGLITAPGWPAFKKGRDGGRDLFKHVRRGGGAMILVDHRMGGAPLAPFMGRPAETSVAAAQLAAKTGAPLVPAVAQRTPTGFVVRFAPAVAPDTPVEMMTEVNARIGAWIDAHPEQWLWLHRRWRVRPMTERGRKFQGADDNDADIGDSAA